MKKGTVAIIISILLIIPASIPLAFFFLAPDFRVCGVDNLNYPSVNEALKKNVDVSYSFPCQFPKSEKGLYERFREIKITGQVIDFFESSSEIILFIRENNSQQYYLSHYFSSSENSANFLPGDQVVINGKFNENTNLVQIDNYQNLSLNEHLLNNVRCEISSINLNNSSINCRDVDNNADLLLNTNSQTRFVSGLINPANIENLNINDLAIVRLNNENLAKLVLVAKSGNALYLKNHYFISNAKFISLENSDNETYLNVKLENFPDAIDWAKNNFDNNIIKIKILDETTIVKKYFGKLSVNQFQENNDLLIAGKINDDYTFEAITIKNNSIWK